METHSRQQDKRGGKWRGESRSTPRLAGRTVNCSSRVQGEDDKHRQSLVIIWYHTCNVRWAMEPLDAACVACVFALSSWLKVPAEQKEYKVQSYQSSELTK